MANLSGINSLYCDKLFLRKPRPSLERSDVFTVFVRNPEGFSRYENSSWTPLDNQHVAGVQDMVDHVTGNVSTLQQQIDALTEQVQTLNDQVNGSNGILSTLSSLGSVVNGLGNAIATIQGLL
jgi:Mg2+ and Co2+ transporter CorA